MSSSNDTDELLVKLPVSRPTLHQKNFLQANIFQNTSVALEAHPCCMSIPNVNAILKLKVKLPKLIQTLTERYSGQKVTLDF